MSELSFGKTFLGVIILSVIVAAVFWQSGIIELNEDSILYTTTTLKTLSLDENNEVEVELGKKFDYKEGYIILRAVYCGFSLDNEYAIVQTDDVTNPQKIEIGNTTLINKEEFKLIKIICGNQGSGYIQLKKV